MYQIRQYKPEDLPAILSLIKQLAAHVGYEEGVRMSLEQLHQDQDWFNCLVAESQDNTCIGIASYFFGYSSWVGKCLFLDDLIVQESWRGKGVGDALFDGIISLAKAHDCQRVRWEVTKENTSAQAFYTARQAKFDEDMILCKLENF